MSTVPPSAIIKILLVDEVGVIDAVKEVATHDVELLANCVPFEKLTVWITVPGVLLVSTVPVSVGSVSVFDPATAGAARVIDPDVSPLITNELIGLPNVNRSAGLPPRQNLM